MNSYIDCHCHALWDVDDGIKYKKDTLILLETAHQNKINRIFMTPHMNVKGKYMPSLDQVQFKLQQLKLMIAQHQLNIEVKLGQELLVDAFGLEYIQTKQHRPYQDTDYVLCEFSVFGFNPSLIDQAIYELSLHKQTLILAHPERYFETPEAAIRTCRHWIKQGAFIQINRTSLLKEAHSHLRRIACALIEANCVHLIASDAHRAIGIRICRLDDSYSFISQVFSTDCAKRLLIDNPNHLWFNETLEHTSLSESSYAKVLYHTKAWVQTKLKSQSMTKLESKKS